MFVADVCTAHVWFHGMDYARVCRTVDVWRCQWHSLYHCTVIIPSLAHSVCSVFKDNILPGYCHWWLGIMHLKAKISDELP